MFKIKIPVIFQTSESAFAVYTIYVTETYTYVEVFANDLDKAGILLTGVGAICASQQPTNPASMESRFGQRTAWSGWVYGAHGATRVATIMDS